MTETATLQFASSGSANVRRWMAIVLFFAVLLQALLINTHVHGTPLVSGVYKNTAINDSSSLGKILPGVEHDACPTCRQVAQFGQFVTPAASVLFAPSVAISIITLIFAAPVVAAVPAFSWQGRAPPR